LTTQAPPLRQSRDTVGGVQLLQKCFKIFQFSQILKKIGISQASGETIHLKNVPMENTCVNVAYISDTNLL
jgi:hypothetical protein